MVNGNEFKLFRRLFTPKVQMSSFSTDVDLFLLPREVSCLSGCVAWRACLPITECLISNATLVFTIHRCLGLG